MINFENPGSRGQPRFTWHSSRTSGLVGGSQLGSTAERNSSCGARRWPGGRRDCAGGRRFPRPSGDDSPAPKSTPNALLRARGNIPLKFAPNFRRGTLRSELNKSPLASDPTCVFFFFFAHASFHTNQVRGVVWPPRGLALAVALVYLCGPKGPLILTLFFCLKRATVLPQLRWCRRQAPGWL